MMLLLVDYWMGRDADYADELNGAIVDHARELLGRVNLLLHWAAADGVWPGTDDYTGTPVASGWRPRLVNDRTRNAAIGSRHLTGEAVDLRDSGDRALARWCLRNLDALGEVMLWMEDPQWTPSWVHLQSVPPRSGRRVYIPTSAQPLIAKLPEQLPGAVA